MPFRAAGTKVGGLFQLIFICGLDAPGLGLHRLLELPCKQVSSHEGVLMNSKR